MSDETPQHEVTRLLQATDNAGPASAERLLTLVYDQLRRIAQQRMSEERAGHTLQATALVHEAYVRLVANAELAWDSRGHFFTAAAEAMRRILIEHARARAREKRGGPDQRRVTMDIGKVADLAQEENTEQIIALDEALRRLESQRPRVARVVHLRFYAGLSVDETARTLGVSARTVDFDWAFARAWLYKELVDAADTPGETDEKRRPRSHPGDLR
jgi:RNA polymerase sigma factor (TIGR02999 family)